MSQQVGQLAVVGDEDQSFAHPVEPTDGKQPLVAGNEIDHSRSSRGIVVGGDGADRLVEHVDDPLRMRQSLTIDPDLLTKRIDPGSQFGDDLAIDFDAALSDQLLAAAAAPEAGGGQHLLQPLEAFPVGGAAGRPGSLLRGRWLPPACGATGRDPGRTIGMAGWHAEIIHRGGSPHCRPPSRPLHFRHWLGKIPRPSAVIEWHPED